MRFCLYGPKDYTRLLHVLFPLSMNLPHFTKHCGEWMHILNEHRLLEIQEVNRKTYCVSRGLGGTHTMFELCSLMASPEVRKPIHSLWDFRCLKRQTCILGGGGEEGSERHAVVITNLKAGRDFRKDRKAGGSTLAA